MTKLTIKLKHGERIIAVVPEHCAGPGWSNAPTWVYIESQDKRLRTECIQPSERTPELHALFSAGEVMCRSLIASVPAKKLKEKAA